MSQQNVDIARRVNAAFNAGDWKTVLELYHPDVEFRDLQHPPDMPEVNRGHGGLARALEQWTQAYDEFGAEAYEFVDADPWVIVDSGWHGKGKGSDVPVEQRYADALKIVDGKIVEWVAGYPDVPTALKAVRRAEPAISAANTESLRAVLRTWCEPGYMEAAARGEADLSLFDSDCTFESTVLPDQAGETYHGHDGVSRAAKGWIEAYEWLLIHLENIIDAGDRLVSVHRVRAKARHTGIEFEAPVAYLWTFRDGKVIHCRAFPNGRRALEAAGLKG